MDSPGGMCYIAPALNLVGLGPIDSSIDFLDSGSLIFHW
jgi:hypothetical protein